MDERIKWGFLEANGSKDKTEEKVKKNKAKESHKIIIFWIYKSKLSNIRVKVFKRIIYILFMVQIRLTGKWQEIFEE